MRVLRHTSVSELFWKLWSSIIDEDVDKMNNGLYLINKKRKDRYQRVIKEVTKREFITFIAFLFEASGNEIQGIRLFTNDRRDKRKGLSPKVDFVSYMKR